MLIRLVLVGLLVLASACGRATDAADGSKPHVVASFYPLAFAVEEVGGSLVTLENLTPPGAEPHDLELTFGQVRSLAEADLVVYLGSGFQPSVEDALEEVDATVVDVLEGQQDLLEPAEQDEHGDHEGGEHDEESSVDPHFWLDPERLGAVADAIAEHLAKLDPADANEYRANAADLGTRLRALDRRFHDALARCERTTLVTSHEAFGYLADAYGLEEVGIAGIDPETEPSPRRLAQVARFVEENGVTTVFFEVLVSPETAETLAREVGIETARLDPLEGPPAEGDYFSAMRSNLDALKRGLACT